MRPRYVPFRRPFCAVPRSAAGDRDGRDQPRLRPAVERVDDLDAPAADRLEAVEMRVVEPDAATRGRTGARGAADARRALAPEEHLHARARRRPVAAARVVVGEDESVVARLAQRVAVRPVLGQADAVAPAAAIDDEVGRVGAGGEQREQRQGEDRDSHRGSKQRRIRVVAVSSSLDHRSGRHHRQ
jgi:hypothetical protein